MATEVSSQFFFLLYILSRGFLKLFLFLVVSDQLHIGQGVFKYLRPENLYQLMMNIWIG